MSREQAVAHALNAFDDEGGGYFAELAECVAIPTESQRPDSLPELQRYLSDAMTPRFEALGYDCRIYENPVEGCGPVLLASRIEGDDLPTAIGYGHGDVILGQEGEWANDRSPWTLSFEGERIYGRGTADNKGQHLAHILALRAVLATRGKLGFNSKFIIEMGEENGSKGFQEVIAQNRDDFAADFYFASDGPRADIARPNISLGNRGCCNFDLVVGLREGGHHSGNWGGLLASPGIILSHAIASIVDGRGKILVDAWRPEGIPDSVFAALKGVERDAGPDAPEIDDDWGEPGFSRSEKVSAWNSFEILALKIGNPEKPLNAVPPSARARCQLRHVVETSSDRIVADLRAHLDAHGFQAVRIEEPPAANQGLFKAARTNPDHPWATWLKAAVDRGGKGDCAVVPCSGGSNVTGIIEAELGIPFSWLPMSYMGCSQHAPDEHIVKPLMRNGMALIAGVYWDLGSSDMGYRP